MASRGSVQLDNHRAGGWSLEEEIAEPAVTPAGEPDIVSDRAPAVVLRRVVQLSGCGTWSQKAPHSDVCTDRLREDPTAGPENVVDGWLRGLFLPAEIDAASRGRMVRPRLWCLTKARRGCSLQWIREPDGVAFLHLYAFRETNCGQLHRGSVTPAVPSNENRPRPLQ